MSTVPIEAGSSSEAPTSPPARRRWVLGVGAAGAAVLAAKALPGSVPAAPVEAASAAPPSDHVGGYRLTAHVQRYYDTARS